MNFVSYVLSSYQPLGKPGFINGWLFVDPVYGVSFTYPNNITGSLFTTTTGSYVYPLTSSGGLFSPWGYIIQNTSLSANLGNYKGQTTITFVPSAIDETFFTCLKIVYDFKQTTHLREVAKYSVNASQAPIVLVNGKVEFTGQPMPAVMKNKIEGLHRS